jgi:tyrosine-protein kinase Etk/Wzc
MNTSSQSSHQQSQTRVVNRDEIDLGKLVGILIDAKWLIVITMVIFTLLGVAYALLATPVYRADALVQVEEKSTGVPGLDDISDMFTAESTADTEIQIVKSRMVLGHTVDQLNLTISAEPKLLPVIGQRLATLLDEPIPTIRVKKLTVPEEMLSQGLTLTVMDNLHFQLTDPDDQVLLAGQVGEIAQGGGVSLLVSSLAAEPGDEFTLTKFTRLMAIRDLRSVLNVAEKGKQTGIMLLSLEGENPNKIRRILGTIAQDYVTQNVERTSAEARQSLVFLRKHIPKIKEQLNEAERKLNEYRLKNDSVDLQLEAESVLQAMVTVESQLNELAFEESDLAQKYTKTHPAYVALLEKRRELMKEKHKLDRKVAKMPKTQQEVIRLSRDVEVNQEIYVQLVGKIQELSVMEASAVGNVRILDQAATMEKPVKPKKVLIVVVTMLAGMIFSVAFVLLREAFHHGVENPDDIEALGLSVYTSIPRSAVQQKLDQHAKRNGRKTNLLAQADPADLSVEALRSLRTSLHFAMMEAKNNVVMFSGPAPGIGKSFVSANFAAIAAQTGQTVLLIDGDMRKGNLQRVFHHQRENGLSDYLSGQLTVVQQIVKPTEIDGLSLITSGQMPPNPAELLMHARFKALIEKLSAQFDLVIIDTPPILAVTDAGIISTVAGTNLMVGRFGVNTLKEIEVARNSFEKMGGEVKGFILNAVERKASNAYGYYGYGYYHYRYGDD